MDIVKVNKLYKGNISLRSTNVDKWIERNTPVKVIYNDAYMILTPEDLSNPISKTEDVSSMYTTETYSLLDYRWEPVTVDARETQILSLIGESWYSKIGDCFNRPYMVNLMKFLRYRRNEVKVYPSSNNVFKAFKLTPYDNVKIVIVGQDPYPDGSADGLAFSSPSPKKPYSLEIIFKELKVTEKANFNLRRDGELTDWAKQGVLLLNTILTVDQGKPLSHKDKGWERFIQEVFIQLNKHPNRLIFVLWGSKAKEYKKFIDSKYHIAIEGNHPAIEYHQEKGFLGCGHFEQINTYIKELYTTKIKW